MLITPKAFVVTLTLVSTPCPKREVSLYEAPLPPMVPMGVNGDCLQQTLGLLMPQSTSQDGD